MTLTSATSCGGKTTRSTRPRLIFQPIQTLSAKSSSSSRHAVRRAVQPRGDVDVLHPLGRVEHDPCALHHPPRQRHRRRAPLKLDALVLRQLDHMAAGPGHKHYFAVSRQPPLHNPQNLRMRPLGRRGGARRRAHESAVTREEERSAIARMGVLRARGTKGGTTLPSLQTHAYRQRDYSLTVCEAA